MITCQGMDNNSATSGDPILIELCNLTAGKIYPIQMVQSTAGCGGASETFNIYVGTANPGGTITNPCPAPGQGSNYLTSPIPECYINACLTSPSCPGCTTYNYNGGLAIDENNIVGNSYYTFTTATGCSNDLQFQQCILSTCHTGNVDWFSFELYDATGTNCIASGDLVSGLTLPGVGCTTKYVIQYTYEMINCNYTDYTPFTDNYGSSTCVLPIELLQFNARENETEGVEVNWVTGTEVNNNYFTVDKSTDGINFSSLGKVTSVHNSEAPTAYTFTDTEPNAQSTVYYRLSQTDMNGDVNKFNIISLSLSHNYSISIYPNPSNGVFSFDFSAQLGSVVMTELTDASGIVLNTQIYAGSGGLQKHTFEVANPGVYMMTVKINGQILHYKLVKI